MEFVTLHVSVHSVDTGLYRTIYVLLFVDSSEDSLQHSTNKSPTEASQAWPSPKTKTVLIPVSKTVGSERLLGEADSNKLLAVIRHQGLLVVTIV